MTAACNSMDRFLKGTILYEGVGRRNVNGGLGLHFFSLSQLLVTTIQSSLCLTQTMSAITTPITELFKIRHPILLAGTRSHLQSFSSLLGRHRHCNLSISGMNVASGPELAAAVTNHGGLGVIGGHGCTPKVLRQQVRPTLYYCFAKPPHCTGEET